MVAARQRLNEVSLAALGLEDDGGEMVAGLVENAAGIMAVTANVDREALDDFLGRRAVALFDEFGAQAREAAGVGEVLDVRPLFAGALGQAFLMGWFVRDEQARRYGTGE